MRAFRFGLVAGCLLAIAALLAAGPARAQAPDELKTLSARFVELYQAGKYAEAAALAERALALAEQRHGPDHPQVAGALTFLGTAHRARGRYAEAEPYYTRALAIFEKSLGANNINVAITLNELAQLYNLQGRLADAEPLYTRALDIEEKLLGPDHPEIATLLNNLAALYRSQAKYGLAESLRKRTIAILEKTKGPDDPQVAVALDNLAVLYQSLERYEEAEPLTVRALGILEKRLGPDHPDVGYTLNNLASIYMAQRKYAQAEPLFIRSLAINEKTLGPTHLEVAKTLDNLAGLYRVQGKYDEAEPNYKRALEIFEATFGPDHPDVGLFYSNLGGFHFDRGNWATSLEWIRKATGVFKSRTRRGLDLIGQKSAGRGRRQAQEQSIAFMRLLKTAHRLAAANGGEAAQLSGEAFEAAQWVHAPEAASSLAQMSMRSATGDQALGALVRERQDLLIAFEKSNGLLVWARSQPTDQRDARVDQLIETRVAALDARLAEVNQKLKEAFPQYASLVASDGLDIAGVQAWLQPGEVLVQFLDTPEFSPFLDALTAKPTPEETFIWVVTKTEARWIRSDLGTKALGERVAALRCGLDHTLWRDDDAAQKCADALGARPAAEEINGLKVQVLPFDTVRAHELYKALLGPAEALIKGKHLLVVPSGPLTSLPFNVLVTEAPKAAIAGKLAGYRDVAWLGARQPITVLPSVASLKALRQFAKASRATKPYLGVGNPLLDGVQDDRDWGDYYKTQAAAAREKQACPAPGSPQLTQRVAEAVTRPHRGLAKLFRGPNADIEEVRHWSPLPETADELCEVGRRLGVPEREILLGARATETTLKGLSDSGGLADYAILHFATHGALTGQVQTSAEPGLILTPPPKLTNDLRALERDDGFLTASEIAALKLDADWVILSACNTAGGSRESAEALSGMARAFFYAGARALLVSHWEVGSAAAVKLTTRAFAELKANPGTGRAEALRRSMRDLVANGTPAEAHPAMWAPFVVVGEGSASLVSQQPDAVPPLTTQAITPPAPAAEAPPAPVKAKRGKKGPSPKAGDWKSNIWTPPGN